ncbi:MAG TPA: hypothetical protein VLD37_05490 [Candidatus Bilamarchaeum sp.]|nr:hypothetical protein [Candidatus Bilamarchaeum sp.]
MTHINGLIHPDVIITAGTTGGLWGWAAISGLALATSSSILAFIYIWGSLFRNPQLQAYVKSELYEIFVSAILIVMIFGLVGSMNNLTVGSFLPTELLPDNVNPGDTVYAATQKYYEKVDSDMAGWLELNYYFSVYVDQMASVTPYARPLGVGLVASPMAGLASPIKQLLYNMSVALSVAFVINHAQLVVYVFSIAAFLKYYLPAGFFLRCFTPTRRIGGTLIGVAVTFLFVFPALSTMTYSMFYNRCEPGDGCGPLVSFRSLLTQYLGDSSVGSFSDRFSNFFGNNFSQSTGGLVDFIGNTFGALGAVFQNLLGSVFLVLLILPASIVSWAFAIGFIIPAFNIIVFTQAARGLSQSFGDEVDISSLTRMI